MTCAFTVDVPAPIAQYDTAHAEIVRRTAGPIDGMILHFGRATATGFQVVEVWESQGQCDRFNNEVVGPVIAEMAAGQPAGGEPVMEEFQPHGLLVAGAAAAPRPMA